MNHLNKNHLHRAPKKISSRKEPCRTQQFTISDIEKTSSRDTKNYLFE